MVGQSFQEFVGVRGDSHLSLLVVEHVVNRPPLGRVNRPPLGRLGRLFASQPHVLRFDAFDEPRVGCGNTVASVTQETSGEPIPLAFDARAIGRRLDGPSGLQAR